MPPSRLAGDLFLPNLDREVVVISDGAVTADPAVAAGVDAPVTLVIAGAAEGDEERANLAVIDVSARPSPSGDGTVGLYASVANFGPQSLTVPVSLHGDGLEIGRSDVTIAGGGAVEPLRWLLPPGVAELTVRIEHADALAADNTASLLPGEAATATIAPRILLVSDLPGALARALMAIENVQLTIEPSDNLAAIAAGGYDLVVFDRTAPSTETLAKIDTASLWVGPPVGGPFATAEGIADPKVTRVRAGDPLLAGVDLSGATFGPTPIFTLSAGDEEIVGSADGPLLFRTEVNDQPAVVLTVDPETSNLPKRVAFPVLVANMVEALAPDGIPAAIPLGEPLVYEPRASTASVEIVPPSGEPRCFRSFPWRLKTRTTSRRDRSRGTSSTPIPVLPVSTPSPKLTRPESTSERRTLSSTPVTRGSRICVSTRIWHRRWPRHPDPASRLRGRSASISGRCSRWSPCWSSPPNG